MTEWNPPRWLVWYGYAWATAFGIPARLPDDQAPRWNDLARFAGTDLEAGLRRLLADEAGAS